MTKRSGIGFDAHPLVEGRPLVLGGVAVPFNKGLLGHSDGDVLVHALIDAILGAARLGDIGTYFPSSDPQYEGADSTMLLAQSLQLVRDRCWRTTYVDATILAEHPILDPFIDQIQQSCATSLGLDHDSVNIKAKSTNGLGFIGRGEGIAALAVATLERIE